MPRHSKKPEPEQVKEPTIEEQVEEPTEGTSIPENPMQQKPRCEPQP